METTTNKEGRKGRTAVFGIFDSKPMLEHAIDMLKENQFRNSDISILMPNPEDSKTIAHEKGTKAPEGAFAGGTSGLALGGALGWLVGVGALAIPGVGPFIAAGPLLSALAGAGIVGTVGGLTGGLIGLGIPKYEAKRYETAIKEGGFLITVHVDDKDWEKKAISLLETCGARDLASTSEVKTHEDEEDTGGSRLIPPRTQSKSDPGAFPETPIL